MSLEELPPRLGREWTFYARIEELQRLARLQLMVENQIQHIQAVRQICGTPALTTNRWLRGVVEIEGFWRDFQREINRAMEEYVSELHWWRWHNTSPAWEIRPP